MEKIGEKDIAAMFIVGAMSAARDAGVSEDDAEAIGIGLCKRASWLGSDDDDDPRETFWDRNKHWLIPFGVGAAAFWAGASGERHGRKDRSYLGNAWSNISNRLGRLFGFNPSPAARTMTDTTHYEPKPHKTLLQLGRDLAEPSDVEVDIGDL